MSTHDRFGELAAAFVYQQRSPNTAAAYRTDLAGFAAWCAGAGVAPMRVQAIDVEDFRAACEDSGVAPATVARRLSALSSFFEHAVHAGALTTSPVQAVSRPVAAPSPTADLDTTQTAALLASSAMLGARTVALVNLLLFDGLKLADVLAADADDVGPTPEVAATLTVTRHDEPVDVELDPRSQAALAMYLGGRHGGPLFMGERAADRDARLTRFGADYLIKQASVLAGLGRAVSANTLRRHFVATAHDGGETIEQIKDRLGHTDVRTTRRHLRAAASPDAPDAMGDHANERA